MQTKGVEAILSGKAQGIGANMLRSVLEVFSYIYGWEVRRRNRKYDAALLDPVHPGITRVSVPVLSVGNITAGGTGKTPFIALLCEYCLHRHMFPAVLMRGYKAKDNSQSLLVSSGSRIYLSPEESGDEAQLISRIVPQAGVIIGRERSVSAAMAINRLDAKVLLLDDGFQHRQLYRDADIVLIDCTNPFGFGHLLPRGLLRESLDGLARASLFVLTKSDQVSEEEKIAIRQVLQNRCPATPIVESIHAPKPLVSLAAWGAGDYETIDAQSLAFLAVSAIGNPHAFQNTLEQAGYHLVDTMPFADHHAYTKEDLARIEQRAKACGANAIVVTEKDAIKLAQYGREVEITIPYYVLPIGLTITDNAIALEQLLNEKLGKEPV